MTSQELATFRRSVTRLDVLIPQIRALELALRAAVRLLRLRDRFNDLAIELINRSDDGLHDELDATLVEIEESEHQLAAGLAQVPPAPSPTKRNHPMLNCDHVLAEAAARMANWRGATMQAGIRPPTIEDKVLPTQPPEDTSDGTS